MSKDRLQTAETVSPASVESKLRSAENFAWLIHRAPLLEIVSYGVMTAYVVGSNSGLSLDSQVSLPLFYITSSTVSYLVHSRLDRINLRRMDMLHRVIAQTSKPGYNKPQ